MTDKTSLSWVTKTCVMGVRSYQLLISPFTANHCRHTPSCSHYSIEAIQTHGVLKGLWMSLKRIAKCHPWGSTGFDPVPPKK